MTKKIFLAGHNGMVGKSIHQKLNELDGLEVITASKKDCDLCNQRQVNNLFRDAHIDEIYIAAARVGGINANQKNLSSFLYENIMIEMNLINSAYENGIEKLLFLGSSCIYPREAKNPIVEDAILSGNLLR